MAPRGTTVTVPCAEELSARQARKDFNQGRARAAENPPEPQVAGKPPYGRPHADCTLTLATPGPDGCADVPSKLVTDAG